jgi:hypothetical protein
MQITASARIGVSPVATFERITDIARLPEWNSGITEVLERPERLQPGSIWKVRMRAFGQSWVSTSMLLELRPSDRIFRYRSQTDDGNPSYAEWEWHVEPDDAGSQVAVTVELHPRTFWRKYLLVHLRRIALRREMRASVLALPSVPSASPKPPSRRP